LALNKAVISDSTTLISLINIDRFELLFLFSEHIIISQAVYNEITYQRAAKKTLDQYIVDKQLSIETVADDKALRSLLIQLDLGESESILLAKKQSLPLIIDEKKGRAVAEAFGLKTIGLIGILYLFKKKNKLSSDDIITIVDELRAVEFRVSESLLKFLLAED
jgi:predicted nucleic acid-binding protein